MGQIPPPLHLKWPLNNTEQKKLMAMWEINKHADSLSEWLFWKYGSGPTITVKWPVGWVLLHQNPDGSTVSADSADPNDHYRPELTARVGKQNRDWMWKMGPTAADNGAHRGYDTLLIKFSRRKAKWSSYFALKWA